MFSSSFLYCVSLLDPGLSGSVLWNWVCVCVCVCVCVSVCVCVMLVFLFFCIYLLSFIELICEVHAFEIFLFFLSLTFFTSSYLFCSPPGEGGGGKIFTFGYSFQLCIIMLLTDGFNWYVCLFYLDTRKFLYNQSSSWWP